MANTEQICLFRSQIIARRFNEETLAILQSIIVSKDLKSLIEHRSMLREFLRSESLSIMRENVETTVYHKLSILEFFVHAFALIGDTESCLALRYEALYLRELVCASHQSLRVSYREWLNFAEQAVDNGFNAIAAKACDSAQLCSQKKKCGDQEEDKSYENIHISERIQRLKESAVTSTASHSIQAQAAGYLKNKTIQKGKKHDAGCPDIRHVATTLFRNGIKRRNERKLHEYKTYSSFSKN
ncbi:hypothetical protein ACFE04_011710 [Oxalis oulophora]